MLGIRAESVVTIGNDRIEEILEESVGFFITSNSSNGFDVGVTLSIELNIN